MMMMMTRYVFFAVEHCTVAFLSSHSKIVCASFWLLLLCLQEGDVVDAELDEIEAEIAAPGELSGEQLLTAKYLGVS